MYMYYLQLWIQSDLDYLAISYPDFSIIQTCSCSEGFLVIINVAKKTPGISLSIKMPSWTKLTWFTNNIPNRINIHPHHNIISDKNIQCKIRDRKMLITHRSLSELTEKFRTQICTLHCTPYRSCSVACNSDSLMTITYIYKPCTKLSQAHTDLRES